MGFQAKTFVAILMVLLFCLGKKCGCSLTEIRSSKVGVSLKFLVVGDWGRQGLYNQSQVAVQMGRIGENLDIDFVISTGDNFYDEGLKGTDDSQFQESFSQIYTAPSLNKTWFTVLGNHDYRGDVLAQLSSDLKHKDPRWICRRSFRLSYSICSPSTTPRDCNAVDFFFLDTTPFVDKYFLPSHHKYDWRGVLPRERYLAQQLKDLSGALGASTAQWKIVVGHHTIRSVGSHGDTQELAQQLLPVLQTHGVDLYINGHDHCLEHISSLRSPLQFLTSGGGSKAWRGINGNSSREGLRFFHDGQGFASVEIQPHSLHVAFYDVDGDVIHELDLMKGSFASTK